MSGKLPMFMLGEPETPAIEEAVNAALNDLAVRFNQVPKQLKFRLLSSFILTVICSHTDLVPLLVQVNASVLQGIVDVYGDPVAGHA